MLELRIIAAGTAVPLFDLPAALGHREAAREIGETIESLIAFMDEMDGDSDLEDDERAALTMRSPGVDFDFTEDILTPDGLAGSPEDAEADGDEEDGNGSEEDFMYHGHDGPGCPIADSDHGEEEVGELTTWPEWHTLPAYNRRAGRFEGKALPDVAYAIYDDAEDDDRDACLAIEDDPKRRLTDGLPGDAFDTEPNGDEGDYSEGLPFWEC